MSDEIIIDDIKGDVHDILANIEYREALSEKKKAAQKALEARRRIEALQEERELEKYLADFEYDFN